MFAAIRVVLWLIVIGGSVLTFQRGGSTEKILAALPVGLAVSGLMLSWIPLLGWIAGWAGLGLGATVALRLGKGALRGR